MVNGIYGNPGATGNYVPAAIQSSTVDQDYIDARTGLQRDRTEEGVRIEVSIIPGPDGRGALTRETFLNAYESRMSLDFLQDSDKFDFGNDEILEMPQDGSKIRELILDQLNNKLYYDDNGVAYPGGDDEALGIGQNLEIIFNKGEDGIYELVPRKQTSVGDLMNNHSTNSESVGVDYLEALGQSVRNQIDHSVSDTALQQRLDTEETIEQMIADQIGEKVEVLTNKNVEDYLSGEGADHVLDGFPGNREIAGYYRQVDRQTGEITMYDLSSKQDREDLLNVEGIILASFENEQLAIFDTSQVELSKDDPDYQLKMESFCQAVISTAKTGPSEEEEEVVDTRPDQGLGQSGVQIPDGTRWVYGVNVSSMDQGKVNLFSGLGIEVNPKYSMAISYSVNFRPDDHNATNSFETLVFVQDNRGQTHAVYRDPDNQWHKLDESQLSDLLSKPCYETGFNINSPSRYNSASLSGQLRGLTLDSRELRDGTLEAIFPTFRDSVRGSL